MTDFLSEVLFINNSRCSTCQKTLKLLEEKNVRVKVMNYLDGELTREILRAVVQASGLRAKELLREKEPEVQALSMNLDDDEAVIEAVLRYPVILQRPIVMKGDRAVVARPPENALKLFE